MKKVIGGGLAAATATGALLFGAAPAQADESFLTCPGGRAGVANAASCAFANNVRYAYTHQPGSVVTAYSPVTDQYYSVQCGEGFSAQLSDGRTVRAARCVGGDIAVVWIW